MCNKRRGPLCGQTNKPFLFTPGPIGLNDAGDPEGEVLCTDTRGVVGRTVNSSATALLINTVNSYRNQPKYNGPPYILGKPNYVQAIVAGFVSVGKKAYTSKFQLIKALTEVVNPYLTSLKIPIPKLSQQETDVNSAGGFSRANNDKETPKGLWIINFRTAGIPLEPNKSPNKFANLCATIMHEYEHAIDAYYAVRFALSKGDKENWIAKRLVIPDFIIKIAKSQPLKVNSIEFLQAEEFYWFTYLTILQKEVENPAKLHGKYEDELGRKESVLDSLKKYNSWLHKDIVRSEFPQHRNGDIPLGIRKKLIRMIEAQIKVLKEKRDYYNKKYISLPAETTGHIVEEIYRKQVLNALKKAK